MEWRHGEALAPGEGRFGEEGIAEGEEAWRVLLCGPRGGHGDYDGDFAKTRRVLIETGAVVRSRCAAQESAKGDPLDDVFAGTPPLFVARIRPGEEDIAGRVAR